MHDELHQQTDSDGSDSDTAAIGRRHVMGNSVRFGKVFGRERLIMALQCSMQDGVVALLELPDYTIDDRGKRAASMCCMLHEKATQIKEV